MSKTAVLEFFKLASEDETLQQQFRAITGIQEMLKLGERNGYSFTSRDVAQASSAPALTGAHAGREQMKVAEIPESSTAAAMGLLHYEWELSELEGFETVAEALEDLKIKPPTVDMQVFERHFRQDDFDFADVTPGADGFQEHYKELLKSERATDIEYTRRPFHLVNLDFHVDHALYDSYFAAKTKLISFFEQEFEDEVRFSGSMWYPPNGYRAWHTNETQPGWRMYVIDFDGSAQEIAGQSFFRYMHPETRELITLRERPKLIRFFKIEQEADKLLWHCIVNASTCSRWSFGFMVSDAWMSRLL